MATSELTEKLQRQNLADGGDIPNPYKYQVFNPYTEFPEFTRKEIKHYQKMFKHYDTSKDNFIDFEELKHMMEKLGHPQTHLALKEMIKEIDEDFDGKINFKEFLTIFRKATKGELQNNSLMEIYRQMVVVDTEQEGVKGAAHFFESKVAEQLESLKFEHEIKEEQSEKKKLEEEKKTRRAQFKEKANFFASQQ